MTMLATDLSDNTNRWGMPPAAARAIAEQAGQSMRYPEAYADTLKRAIGGYTGAPPEAVVTGCGSDDVLDAAVRACGDPGDRLATCDPSFVMVPQFARLNGLTPIPVSLTSSGDIDVTALLRTQARIIYVCSPNNPTGTVTSCARVAALAESTSATVIVDEAYAEFARESLLDLALTRPNVVVVRTMSKAFGLAGLRVGYAVANPGLAREIETVRGPYKVNALALAAATAALEEDLGWMRTHASLVRDLRTRFAAALCERGLTPLPSAANFVFVPLASADRIAVAMRAVDAVAVRAFTGLCRFNEELAASDGAALRITIGPWDELERALVALDRARIACA
jgi:histidinol-phosphate aminotransferase